jgi:hypothetical protein
VFCSKFFVAFYRLSTDANYHGIGLLKNLELVLKRAGLGCASGTVVFGVKINHQLLFAKNCIDIEQIAVLIGQRKRGDSTADFEFVHGIVFIES